MSLKVLLWLRSVVCKPKLTITPELWHRLTHSGAYWDAEASCRQWTRKMMAIFRAHPSQFLAGLMAAQRPTNPLVIIPLEDGKVEVLFAIEYEKCIGVHQPSIITIRAFRVFKHGTWIQIGQ
jgi:hypothetical protein